MVVVVWKVGVDVEVSVARLNRSKEKKEFNSFLSFSLSFFYLWPPSEDRRDDPILRELEPRGPADAGALLRGRLSDVEAEPDDYYYVFFRIGKLAFVSICWAFSCTTSAF